MHAKSMKSAVILTAFASIINLVGCFAPDPSTEVSTTNYVTRIANGDRDGDGFADNTVRGESLTGLYCFDAEEGQDRLSCESAVGQALRGPGDCDSDTSDDPAACNGAFNGLGRQEIDNLCRTNTALSTCATCVNPNAIEICDGVDNNCDGQVDPGCDPCEGIECMSPPENTCADGMFTQYSAEGQCADGECEYEQTTTECEFGCNQTGDACASDPCEGIECMSPPENTCADGMFTQYSAEGQCAGGECVYEQTTTECEFGCNQAGDACALECDSSDDCALPEVCLDNGSCGLPGCNPDNDLGPGGEAGGDCADYRPEELGPSTLPGRIYGYGCFELVLDGGVCVPYEDRDNDEFPDANETICDDNINGDLQDGTDAADTDCQGQVPCVSDRDCLAGSFCDDDAGFCVAGCQSHSDCAEGEQCLNINTQTGIGSCQMPGECTTNADCGSGQVCEMNQCRALGNIIMELRRLGTHTQALGAIQAAGLTSSLEGTGPFTVFAPNDVAFTSIPADVLAAFNGNQDVLEMVLLYHVMNGRLRTSNMTNGQQILTLVGDTIMVRVEANRLHIYLDGNYETSAEIVLRDVPATNGLIHVIDAVLLPGLCATNDDCPEGEMCAESNLCVSAPDCIEDTDCANGDVCESGACVSPSQCDPACGLGNTCDLTRNMCVAVGQVWCWDRTSNVDTNANTVLEPTCHEFGGFSPPRWYLANQPTAPPACGGNIGRVASAQCCVVAAAGSTQCITSNFVPEDYLD